MWDRQHGGLELSDFGERLREERMRTGLNQIDFGDLAGVSKNAQLNYEKGERSPDANYLMALLQHGIDVHYLLTGVRASQAGASLTPEQSRLLWLWAELGADDRAVLGRVLDVFVEGRKG